MNNGVLVQSQNQLIVPFGLVGYWSLNDGSGLIARDFSGNGKNGIVSSSYQGTTNPIWATGRIGGGLNFSATTSPVVISTTSFLGTGAGKTFSISFWFYATTLTIYDSIIRIGGAVSTNDCIIIGLRSTTTYYIDTWATDYSVTANSALNTWYHICLTADGTNFVFYHNGVNKNTTARNPNFVDGPSWFGAGNPAVIRHFGGSLDDVRIYNRVLTAAEVQQLYLAGGT